MAPLFGEKACQCVELGDGKRHTSAGLSAHRDHDRAGCGSERHGRCNAGPPQLLALKPHRLERDCAAHLQGGRGNCSGNDHEAPTTPVAGVTLVMLGGPLGKDSATWESQLASAYLRYRVRR